MIFTQLEIHDVWMSVVHLILVTTEKIKSLHYIYIIYLSIYQSIYLSIYLYDICIYNIQYIIYSIYNICRQISLYEHHCCHLIVVTFQFEFIKNPPDHPSSPDRLKCRTFQMVVRAVNDFSSVIMKILKDRVLQVVCCWTHVLSYM